MYMYMLLVVVLLVVCVSLYSVSLSLCLSVSLSLCISVSGSRYLTSCWSRAPRVPLRSYVLSSYSMLLGVVRHLLVLYAIRLEGQTLRVIL